MTTDSKEMSFAAVFDALLLLWRRDYPGERLITDDGSGREFMLPDYEGGPFTFTRTSDPPGRTAPLANALVQLMPIRLTPKPPTGSVRC